jgi:hypothetical protein
LACQGTDSLKDCIDAIDHLIISSCISLQSQLYFKVFGLFWARILSSITRGGMQEKENLSINHQPINERINHIKS